MQSPRPELTAWLLSVIALLCLTSRAAAADRPIRQFEIPAGEAIHTLNEFSRQANIQVLFDFARVKGRKTQAAHGALRPTEALEVMLAHSGLVYYFVNDRTLAVVTEEEAAKKRGSQSVKRTKISAKPVALEEVQIIGSQFLQQQISVGRQLITFDRADIERTGLSTVQDFLRTLPQNFGGGPTEDTDTIGRETLTNSAEGIALNLRAMGSSGTLTLINGRRMAPSGTEGAFSDISNLPLNAIERIEIMPGAESVRYGSDAIGGVVNFITRSSHNGSTFQVQHGAVTDGPLDEQLLGYIIGARWRSTEGVLAFEYRERDALAADDRRLATSDLTVFGGDDFNTQAGNPGTITDGINTWAIPHGQDGTSIEPEDFVLGTKNLYDRRKGTDILGERDRWNVFGSLRHAVNDDLDLFTDVLLSYRTLQMISLSQLAVPIGVPPTNPFYVKPTGYVTPDGGTGPIRVMYAFGNEMGPVTLNAEVTTGNVVLGANFNLSHDRVLTTHVSHTLERQHTLNRGLVDPSALAEALADPDPTAAFNPFGHGASTNPETIEKLRMEGVFELNSSFTTANASIGGSLFNWSGRDVLFSAGTEYRRQLFDAATYSTPSTIVDIRRSLQRDTLAAYGEVRLPVIAAEDGKADKERLELSLSGRYEDHDGIEALTPRIGLAWAPLESLVFRGAWAKAFKVPNLTDLSEADNRSSIVSIPDPESSSGIGSVLVWSGRNADLKPESAESWSAGVDLTLGSAPKLSFALTYFDIFAKNRVENVFLQTDMLSNPALLTFVTRDVGLDQRARVCARSTFDGMSGECLTAPIGAIVDIRVHNIALLETRGVDVSGKLSWVTSAGDFGLTLDGTYLFDFSQALTPTESLTRVLNTQNNPIDLRLRGSLSWHKPGFGADLFVNYADNYRDTASQPNRKVDSWTTWDLRISHEFARQDGSWLDGTRLALSIQNLADEGPPFLNNHIGIGYDQENADLLGRFASFSISKSW